MELEELIENLLRHNHPRKMKKQISKGEHTPIEDMNDIQIKEIFLVLIPIKRVKQTKKYHREQKVTQPTIHTLMKT